MANLSLPERQREVLALKELEDLSYDEIAEIMGMNRNSVAQLISRARINLRSALQGDGPRLDRVHLARLRARAAADRRTAGFAAPRRLRRRRLAGRPPHELRRLPPRPRGDGGGGAVLPRLAADRRGAVAVSRDDGRGLRGGGRRLERDHRQARGRALEGAGQRSRPGHERAPRRQTDPSPPAAGPRAHGGADPRPDAGGLRGPDHRRRSRDRRPSRLRRGAGGHGGRPRAELRRAGEEEAPKARHRQRRSARGRHAGRRAGGRCRERRRPAGKLAEHGRHAATALQPGRGRPQRRRRRRRRGRRGRDSRRPAHRDAVGPAGRHDRPGGRPGPAADEEPRPGSAADEGSRPAGANRLPRRERAPDPLPAAPASAALYARGALPCPWRHRSPAGLRAASAPADDAASPGRRSTQ